MVGGSDGIRNAQWLQFSEMQAVCFFASDIMLVIAKDTIFTMESFNPCLVPRIAPYGLIGLIRNKVKVHCVITTRANNVIILVLHGGTHII